MLKLRQISIALVLALMLCVTMLGSSAFAQSVTHSNTRAIATQTVDLNIAQPATTDLQQIENLQRCYWVPDHSATRWYWVPKSWTKYPYPHWILGHWMRFQRWVPGHWVPNWCRPRGQHGRFSSQY